MTLDRSQVKAAALPQRAVAFAPFGGDVLVRGLRLDEQFEVQALRRRESAQRDGETEQDATRRAGVAVALHVLALSVVQPDFTPLQTLEEWQIHAVSHLEAMFALSSVAIELSGGGDGGEKNS